MKYCKNCGAAIDNAAVFCPACGAPQPKKSKKGLLIALISLVVVAGIGLYLYLCVFTVSMGNVRSKRVTLGNSIYVQKEDSGLLSNYSGQIYVFDGNGNYRWFADNNGSYYAFEYGTVDGEEKIVAWYSYRTADEGTYTLEDNLLTLNNNNGSPTQYFLEDRDGELAFHLVDNELLLPVRDVFRNGEDTHSALEDNYQKARSLYAAGNVQEAQQIFKELGDYMDSLMWYLVCKGVVDEPRK